MKIYFNKWFSVVVSSILLLTSLESCVKNRNDLATDFSKLTPVVELIAGEPIVTGNPVRFRVFAFPITPEPINLNLYVNYAYPGLAPNDIVVTLALNPAELVAINAANHAINVANDTLPDPPPPLIEDYAIPSSDAFSFPTLTVTIKKGERFAKVPLIINITKIDPALHNAIPLKIVDASGVTISANNDHIVYVIAPKNEWDGDYDVTGWFFHPSAGRGIKRVKHLSTVNAIRLEGTIGDLGLPFQFDVVNNKLVNWASAAFTSTGFMTADNPGGVNYSDPSNSGYVPGDATFNSTIYNNTYDPATKTFYMHYGYRAGVVTGQNGYTRQIYEKWVRK